MKNYWLKRNDKRVAYYAFDALVQVVTAYRHQRITDQRTYTVLSKIRNKLVGEDTDIVTPDVPTDEEIKALIDDIHNVIRQLDESEENEEKNHATS